MFGIGPTELVLIGVVALLVFGPKRLPELARNLGRGLAEFRRASNDLRQTLALDDLQNDLRRDIKTSLDAVQSIHRPGDRPAQAGDDLPPAAGGPGPRAARANETADPAASGTETRSGAEEPEAGATTGAASARGSAHPGELPLDNDHEHHDVDEPDDDGGSQAADSPLGNVPVTGTPPAGSRRG